MTEYALMVEQNKTPQPPFVFGCSSLSKKMLDFAETVAQTEHTVLLEGRTGVGKGLFAEYIHWKSNKPGKFFTVKCTTLPGHLIESLLFGHTGEAYTGARHSTKGIVEAATGGTLFFDEIGDMPLELQAKLLGILEKNPIRMLGSLKETAVATRIIAATNMDLVEAIRQGRFREDLYYRLNVFQLTMPSLKEHKEDIPNLVDHFLCEQQSKKVCTGKTMEYMLEYDWPGNVRELKNAIICGITFGKGEKITPQDLHLKSVVEAYEPLTLHAHTQQYFLSLFKKTNGDIALCARIAGITEAEVKSWMIECAFMEQFRNA